MSEQDDVVSTRLAQNGLDQTTVDQFQMAGITTLEKLAKVKSKHFEGLGIPVEQLEQRSKLFFLIEEVKEQVAKQEKQSPEERELFGDELLNSVLLNEEKTLGTATGASHHGVTNGAQFHLPNGVNDPMCEPNAVDYGSGPGEQQDSHGTPRLDDRKVRLVWM